MDCLDRLPEARTLSACSFDPTAQNMDPESLQKVGRRRGCLDAFLVVSVIFLFLSVAAIVAGGVMVMKNLQDNTPKSAFIGSAPPTGYKVNTSFLLSARSELCFLLEVFHSDPCPLHIFSPRLFCALINRWRTLCICEPRQVSHI